MVNQKQGAFWTWSFSVVSPSTFSTVSSDHDAAYALRARRVDLDRFRDNRHTELALRIILGLKTAYSASEDYSFLVFGKEIARSKMGFVRFCSDRDNAFFEHNAMNTASRKNNLPCSTPSTLWPENSEKPKSSDNASGRFGVSRQNPTRPKTNNQPNILSTRLEHWRLNRFSWFIRFRP